MKWVSVSRHDTQNAVPHRHATRIRKTTANGILIVCGETLGYNHLTPRSSSLLGGVTFSKRNSRKSIEIIPTNAQI